LELIESYLMFAFQPNPNSKPMPKATPLSLSPQLKWTTTDKRQTTTDKRQQPGTKATTKLWHGTQLSCYVSIIVCVCVCVFVGCVVNRLAEV